MDLNATIDFIIRDLTDIKEILDDLKHCQGVPGIEVELAKSKCRSVIEVIALMKDMDKKPVITKEENKEKIIEPVQGKEHHHDKIEEPLKEPAQVISETAGISAKKEPEKEEIASITVEKPVESKPAPSKLQEHQIIADQFSNRPESFNEMLLSRKHGEDVMDVLNTKPVSNLTEAIGINDKFLFIREIFNGDQESYDLALEKVDSASSMEDATSTILSFAGENKDNDAVKLFMSILKRKFHSNE